MLLHIFLANLRKGFFMPNFRKIFRSARWALAVGCACAATLAAAQIALGDLPDIKREPGSWSVKIIIEELEGDGLGPDSKAQMQRMIDAQSNAAFCLTPEKAAQEDFVGNAVRRNSPGQCTVKNQEMVGDSLKLLISCTGNDRQNKPVSMMIDGLIGPRSNETTMQTISDGTQPGSVKMKMRTLSKLEGACTPGQKEI
jgi:hypothetical protein